MKKNQGWYLTIGIIVGLLVFAGVWLYALSTWGLLLGLIFGWIPALIAGAVSVFIWPIFVLIGIWLYSASHSEQTQVQQVQQGSYTSTSKCTTQPYIYLNSGDGKCYSTKPECKNTPNIYYHSSDGRCYQTPE